MDKPTPKQIEAARLLAGHSQTSAGEMVGCTLRTWQNWEYGERSMPPGLWELYRLLMDQHPVKKLVNRC